MLEALRTNPFKEFNQWRVAHVTVNQSEFDATSRKQLEEIRTLVVAAVGDRQELVRLLHEVLVLEETKLNEQKNVLGVQSGCFDCGRILRTF